MSRLVPTILVLATVACTHPEYPLCSTDDGCRAAEICRNGNCVQCTSDTQCIAGSSCIDGVCEASLDGCSKNADCDQGHVCLFELCTTCFEDDHCDEGLRCVEGACVGCAEDSECDEPLVCLEGFCAEPPPEDDPDMVIGPEGCVIEPVYFEFDSDELTEETKKTLDNIAGCLPRDDTTVAVGFTDPMGDHFYNLNLGLRRAEAVVAYLTNKGLDANLLVATTVGTKGAGKDEQKARRVEFLWSRALAALTLIALCGCGPKGPVDEPAPEGVCTSDDDCGPADQCREGFCAPYEGQLDDPCYDDLDCALHLRCQAGECFDPEATQESE